MFVNPHALVAQKVADELVLRCFQGEEVDFFKSNLTFYQASDECTQLRIFLRNGRVRG